MMKKMTKEMADIVEHIVDYLKSLPDGTEISTSEAVEYLYNQKMCEFECIINGYELSFEDYFILDSGVIRKASKCGLMLDQSKYDGMVGGLHYKIPYIITRKAKKHD